MTIDFKELGRRGGGLEALSRSLLRHLKCEISPSGEGPDGGRDILARVVQLGPIRPFRRTWVVECKDNSVADRAVGIGQVPDILDRLGHHNADGFLLVTTTRVTSALASRIESINENASNRFVAAVWDSTDLARMLLEPSAGPLLKQFFPGVYRASLEDSIGVLKGAGLPADLQDLVRASLVPTDAVEQCLQELVSCISQSDFPAAFEVLRSALVEVWSAALPKVEGRVSAQSYEAFMLGSVGAVSTEQAFALAQLALDWGISVESLVPALAELDHNSISILLEETEVRAEIETLLQSRLETYEGDEYGVDGGSLWGMDDLVVSGATSSALYLEAEFSARLNCTVGAGDSWELPAEGEVKVILTAEGMDVTEVVHLPDLTG